MQGVDYEQFKADDLRTEDTTLIAVLALKAYCST